MKQNRSTNIISLILIVTILATMIPFSSITVSAEQLINENDSADNVLQNIRTDEDFADDTILVILTNQVSINCDSFTINDFAEVNPTEIKNLSEPKEQQIKAALQTISNNPQQSNYMMTEELSEINKFNQVLRIKLSTPGKDNVLKAIKELEKREDVLYAGPDYYWTYSS